VELVLPSGIKAVVVDACWREFSQYKRLSRIRRVVLPRTVILDGRCFWAPELAALKWQYILIAAFSSYISFDISHVLSGILNLTSTAAACTVDFTAGVLSRC